MFSSTQYSTKKAKSIIIKVHIFRFKVKICPSELIRGSTSSVVEGNRLIFILVHVAYPFLRTIDGQLRTFFSLIVTHVIVN